MHLISRKIKKKLVITIITGILSYTNDAVETRADGRVFPTYNPAKFCAKKKQFVNVDHQNMNSLWLQHNGVSTQQLFYDKLHVYQSLQESGGQ